MIDTTTRAGIPTFYGGVRYCSRLEARWAAFFELLGWPAHYEPFDLNGWIPDFVLHGRLKGCEQIPVEVKPVRGMDDPLFKATADKIVASGWGGQSLIVSYFLPRADWGPFGVGWCTYLACEPFQSEGVVEPWWDVAAFQRIGRAEQSRIAAKGRTTTTRSPATATPMAHTPTGSVVITTAGA
jgi:hypothetical protein